MFRIVLYALWSRDYEGALIRVLEEAFSCDYEQARKYLQALADHRVLSLRAPSPGYAYKLASQMMRFGAYTQVEQVGPLKRDDWIADGLVALPENAENWWVVDSGSLANEQAYWLEKTSLVGLRFASDEVTQALSKEMRCRGAETLSEELAGEVEKRMEKARSIFVRWATKNRARNRNRLRGLQVFGEEE